MRVHIQTRRILITVLLLLSFTSQLSAGAIRLSWQPNTELDLSGYHVYIGTQSRVYDSPIPVGKVNNYDVVDLKEGQIYFFAVSAVDNSGNESGFSREVSKQIAMTEDKPPVVIITTPVQANTYTTENKIIALAGNASDDRGLQQIAWTCSTGKSGIASGTESWSIDAIELAAGKNVITITALDSAGNRGTAVITVTVAQPAPSVPIGKVSTSADDGNVGSNTIDNNLGTRWSARGSGQWIQYDLEKSFSITQLAMAFFRGDERKADFEVLVSDDANSWNSVLKSTSSGATLEQESYSINKAVARYVRIVGYGNTKNAWNSITEVDIMGDAITAMEAPISVVDVSTSADDGNVGSNTIDGNLTTRWSAKGDGQWIQYDLGTSHTLTQMAMAFFRGDERKADFEVLVSDDANSWNSVLKSTSSGATLEQESYSINKAVARYVRIVGYGNTKNAWNSITEVDIMGDAITAMEAPISVVDVSTSADDGNVGSNTIDGNLTTRWSAKGDGQWIQYDLGTSHTLTQMAIAFYQGNQRSADFEILISEDAITWDNILKATSSGTTLTQESYQIKGTPARYVRLVGYGNSINSWNSITEVDILGIDQQYASN